MITAPCTHLIVPTARGGALEGKGEGLVPGDPQGPVVSGLRDSACGETGVWFSPEPPLTFRDTVLRRQESFLEQALQHGAHRGPVDQLQHKEVGLPRKSRDSDPAMWLPCPLTVCQRLNTAKGPTSTVMPC